MIFEHYRNAVEYTVIWITAARTGQTKATVMKAS